MPGRLTKTVPAPSTSSNTNPAVTNVFSDAHILSIPAEADPSDVRKNRRRRRSPCGSVQHPAKKNDIRVNAQSSSVIELTEMERRWIEWWESSLEGKAYE